MYMWGEEARHCLKQAVLEHTCKLRGRPCSHSHSHSWSQRDGRSTPRTLPPVPPACLLCPRLATRMLLDPVQGKDSWPVKECRQQQLLLPPHG